MAGVTFHPGSNRALVESQTFNRKATPPFSFTHFLIVPPPNEAAAARTGAATAGGGAGNECGVGGRLHARHAVLRSRVSDSKCHRRGQLRQPPHRAKKMICSSE